MSGDTARQATARASAERAGTPAGSSRGLRERALRDVVVLWMLSRVLFEGIALVAVGIGGPVADKPPGFFGLLHHWDSNWFDAIARNGYFGHSYVDVGHPGARTAFFPGYPLLARVVAWVLGGGHVTASSSAAALWLVPFVASFVAAYCLYRLVEARFGLPIARWSAGLLLFGPYAVFLAASYSEALYLALAIPAWWAVTRHRYLLAGLLGAAASFSRINGVFLGIALLVLYLQQQRESGQRVRPAPLAAIAVSFAGVAGYMGWLWGRTGRPTEFLHAQADRFGHRGTLPWVAAYHQLKQPFHDPHFDYKIQTVAEAVTALLLAVAFVVLVRAREWAAATLTLLSVLTFITNSTYLSLARNSITLFPVTVLAAVLVVRCGRRRVVATALAAAFALALLNAVLFALGYWAD